MGFGEFVVLDIETTGLSRERHKITEIAALKVRDDKVVDSFESLVDPQVPIPRFITRLTGIDDEMVKDADPIYEVLPKFMDFLGENVMLAHNASFDYGFLNHNSILHREKEIRNNRLCTRKLATRLLPKLPSKRLSCLCEHYQIKNENAHRAMADAYATFNIFSRFQGLLNERGINNIYLTLDFEKMPPRKCICLESNTIINK